MIINFMEIGWAASHWNHHRYTNQASDPDCQLYSRYQSFWSRLLFARLASNRVNLANTLRMLLGKPLRVCLQSSISAPRDTRSGRIQRSLLVAMAFYIHGNRILRPGSRLSIHRHTPRPWATLYRSAPLCGTCRHWPAAVSGRAYSYVTVFQHFVFFQQLSPGTSPLPVGTVLSTPGGPSVSQETRLFS